MIGDTRRIEKITGKVQPRILMRGGCARVMQRSCLSTPTDPSVPFLFWDN
jgi:hypothetical protein